MSPWVAILTIGKHMAKIDILELYDNTMGAGAIRYLLENEVIDVYDEISKFEFKQSTYVLWILIDYTMDIYI